MDNPALPTAYPTTYGAVAGSAFESPAEYGDVAQGSVSDCWLAAVLASIAFHRPAYMASVVSDTVGTIRVTLAGTAYDLSKEYPLRSTGEMYGMGLGPNGSLWPAAVEKAFASKLGGYARLVGGDAKSAYDAILGQGTEEVTLNGMTGAEILSLVIDRLDRLKLVCLVTRATAAGKWTAGHAYAVLSASSAGVMVYNPRGFDGGTAYGDPNDGILLVTADDLAANFLHADVANASMANITLSGAANWSTCNGGSAPGAADNIYLNGYALTLNGSEGATYTCALIRACQTDGTTPSNGTVVLGTSAAYVIAANLRAGSETLLTVGAGKTITVNGTVTGGSSTNARGILNSGGTITSVSALVGGSTTGANGLNNSTGTLTSVGTVTGGTADAVAGLVNASGRTIASVTSSAGSANAYGTNNAGTITLMGSSTGGSAGGTHGTVNSGTITITTATGGGFAGSYGVTSSGTCTVTTAKGGTVAGALGALCSLGTLTINGTDLTGTGYPCGVSAGVLKLATGVLLQYADTSGVLLPFAQVRNLAPSYKIAQGQAQYTGGPKGTYANSPMSQGAFS